jgi:hypothetical protein
VEYELDCKLCEEEEATEVIDRIREKAPDVPEAEVFEDVAEASRARRSER